MRERNDSNVKLVSTVLQEVKKKIMMGCVKNKKFLLGCVNQISRNLSLFLPSARPSKKIIFTIRIFRFPQTPIYFSKSRTGYNQFHQTIQPLLLVYNWILPVSPNHPDISPSL